MLSCENHEGEAHDGAQEYRQLEAMPTEKPFF